LRPRHPVLAALLAVVASGCAIDKASRTEETGRGPDPLVKERVMARMDEIAAPAQQQHATIRKRSQAGECEGICDLVDELRRAAERVCELAADYPGDEDVQLKCRWPKADCDEAEAACENCGGRPEESVY